MFFISKHNPSVNLIVPSEWLHDFVSDKILKPLKSCHTILPTPTMKAAYKYQTDSLVHSGIFVGAERMFKFSDGSTHMPRYDTLCMCLLWSLARISVTFKCIRWSRGISLTVSIVLVQSDS